MEQIFKRLGHLGEIHLVDQGEVNTLCGTRSDGANFFEVGPVDIAPRADPTLCPDCKEAFDARNPPAEKKPKKAKKAPAKKEEPKEEPKTEAKEEAKEEASEEETATEAEETE